MARSPIVLARRVAEVFRRHGPVEVAAKSVRWFARRAWESNDYLVYARDLDGEPLPSRSGIDVTAVCEPGDIDRLPVGIRQRLGHRLAPHLASGGMLFCVLRGEVLAHQSWVSVRPPSEIDPIAAVIEYRSFGYIGACETDPEFRGLGLYPAALARACEELRARGFARAILTVSPENRASISGIVRAGFRPAGRGRLTRRFGRSSWEVLDPDPAGGTE